MTWLYRGLMAASMIGVGLVSGGVLPVAYTVVFAAVGGAAALFHDSPNASGK